MKQYLPSDALLCAGSPPPTPSTTMTTTTSTTTTTTTTRGSGVYYGWSLYGFTFWYQVGTPQEVFDIFMRDLAFIENVLPSWVVNEVKDKIPIYLTLNSNEPRDYPKTHSMIKYHRNWQGKPYGAIEVFNYDDFIRATNNDQPSIVLHAIAKGPF